MVRGSDEFDAAAAGWVCVRVTDMAKVDLNVIRFDFDLTFAVVLMHADGTIYHRYGSRDAHDASSWTSMASLARLLRDSLDDHREYSRAPSPPPAGEPLRAIDLPVLRQKIAAGQRLDCVHCHTVNDAEHALALQQQRWTEERRWVCPDPSRIGLRLDAGQQDLVREVAADSAAARAGIRPGDRLRRLGAQRRVRTIADVSWALHELPAGDARAAVAFVRGDGAREIAAELELTAGWKRCAPEDYAWRPYKWNLSPAPGFGGPGLDAAERQRLGIDAGVFAFRVQYLVDWGERAHRGRAAKAAGLRKGDVVVAFAGKSDFASVDHFHAWVRLTRTAGEEVEIVVLRDGARHTLRYALPE